MPPAVCASLTVQRTSIAAPQTHSCERETASAAPFRDSPGSQAWSERFWPTACFLPHGEGTRRFLRGDFGARRVSDVRAPHAYSSSVLARRSLRARYAIERSVGDTG